MKNVNLKSTAMLLLAALIWGAAFVAQSVGMDHLGAFTFNGARSILGALVLIPLIIVLDKRAGKKFTFLGTNDPKEKRELIKASVLCGVVLTLGSTFQQFGIAYTTVGKAGFITAMYIIIVPLMGIFMKKKITPLLIVSVVVAVGGMYLLCRPESGEAFNIGDILMIFCAFGFSTHIMLIDKYAVRVDPVRLSCIQFFICGILCMICAFIFETPKFENLIAAYVPLLYAGIFSCGVAYTLQAIGQRGMNPVVASLILSLESVFAVLAGWIILGQTLTTTEFIGCALMFAAIIMAQIPVKSKSK